VAGGPSELDVSRFARAVHPAAGIVPQMNDTQDSMTSGIWRSNRSSIEATGTSERGETHSEGEVKAKAEDIANGVGGQGVGGAVAEVMRWTDVGLGETPQQKRSWVDAEPADELIVGTRRDSGDGMQKGLSAEGYGNGNVFDETTTNSEEAERTRKDNKLSDLVDSLLMQERKNRRRLLDRRAGVSEGSSKGRVSARQSSTADTSLHGERMVWPVNLPSRRLFQAAREQSEPMAQQVEQQITQTPREKSNEDKAKCLAEGSSESLAFAVTRCCSCTRGLTCNMNVHI
jgi:hypothetical protein